MWRKIFSTQLKTLAASAVACPSNRFIVTPTCRSVISPSSSFLVSRYFSVDAGSVKTTVEDVMPIATGHEREEIEAELEGRKLLDINFPEGPFGTKESPAVVKSYYDKRIVGCPGGEGEDEHDVVWFWLSKDTPHECPVCSQYFVLEVVGPGGDPEEGHGHH